jgi:hypothetical protein
LQQRAIWYEVARTIGNLNLCKMSDLEALFYYRLELQRRGKDDPLEIERLQREAENMIFARDMADAIENGEYDHRIRLEHERQRRRKN